MDDDIPRLSDVDLLAAMVGYDAALPAGVTGLSPVPTHRRGRPAWAILAVEVRDTVDGERVGPVRGVRLVSADDGTISDEPYAGPEVSSTAMPLAAADMRRRLHREITISGAAFFAGRPAEAAWMRVALRMIFPGDLILALAAVAPDFLAWLADSPADRAG